MIKLTYKQMNGEFFEALNEVKSKPFPTKTAYSLGKIFTHVENAIGKARDEHKILLKNYVHLDEKEQIKSFPGGQATDPTGKPMVTAEGVAVLKPTEPYKFLDGKEVEYHKAMETFFEKTLTLEYHPISLHDFGTTELTPETLMALEPLINPLSAV